MTECLHVGLGPSLASISGRSLTQQHVRLVPLRCCSSRPRPRSRHVCAIHSQVEDRPTEVESKAEGDRTTEKYGLEAGLWKVFTSKNAEGKTKGDQAKDLLARYGGAYLVTSISFAIVSFAACYALVNAGVDVAALLKQLGLEVNTTSEKVGTAAIAYAAHKALSPVRFPPTVALTPVVARFLGTLSKKAAPEEPGE